MLISKKHRFIFVHIPKNAGTSITTAMRPVAACKWVHLTSRALREVRFSAPFDPQPYHQHIKGPSLRDMIGREYFESLFSFAFVRNPWDWQVSLYHYTLKNQNHPNHQMIKSFGCFDNYIKWRCNNEPRFQKDFIYTASDELVVDFVGRYENLEADFAQVCDRIGVAISLPKLNVSNTTPYQSFYTDETRDLVARAFQPDISAFGYSF